jgi:hypothetical protein
LLKVMKYLCVTLWGSWRLFEVSEVHQDSISQSGSCLGNVSVHSLTLSYIPKSIWCDSWASSWLAPFRPYGLFALTRGLPLGPQPCIPFTLVTSPKLRLRHFWHKEEGRERGKTILPNTWVI